jgi:hypothetical protein
MGKNGFHDEKALQKQVLRQSTDNDRTDRPLWTLSLYQYTSKVSKQVVRFLKYNFSKTASQILYDKQLKPMLLLRICNFYRTLWENGLKLTDDYARYSYQFYNK